MNTVRLHLNEPAIIGTFIEAESRVEVPKGWEQGRGGGELLLKYGALHGVSLQTTEFLLRAMESCGNR